MELFEIVILGVLQGLTEFLPVSSSGHLVLGQYILGIKSPGNTLEILFHFGTLGSVVFVFFDEIKNIFVTIDKKPTQKLLVFISIATLPAMFVGLLFRHEINLLFDSLDSVGYALCLTGLILIISIFSNNKKINFSYHSSLVIGLVQAFAIIPGISRSGFTIVVSLFLGISPKKSAKFSFLLSIPIIFGAGLLSFFDLQNENFFTFSTIMTAILSSFFVGILALKGLLKLLEQGKFYFFGIYCIFIGIISILV
ncbi:MAG: hypothetical protein CBD77_04595 [bacterium TMED217]|nr:MAG: hypothetical protein CBD77_04595 [bacterium TMED217]|tara:strand:+ start:766 stop:1524 length:759 start_codon:yes stop_codon:yes gene_type:complete